MPDNNNARDLGPMGGADDYIQAMFEATPLVIILWNKDFQIIDCNQEMVRMTGASGKQECIDSFFKFAREYQPNGRKSKEMAAEKLAEAFKTGRCRFEWMFWSAKGERMPFEVTLVRINYRNDDFVISYANDLRDLKASLAKTREANERTQFMFEKAPMIIMMWDKDNKVLDCNEEAIRLYGVKDKQDYIDRFYELAPEYQPNGQKSADMADEKHREAFENGSSHFEWTHRDVKGEEIPCEVHIYRIKNGDDYAIVSYAKDLRPVKKSIAEIKEANERTQFMFENTPAVIMMWDKHYRIVDCNMEAIRVFGLKDKKEYIERFIELAPEYQPNGQKSTEMVVQKLDEAFQTGTCRLEWTHHSASGEAIPFFLRAFRVKYGDDDVVVSYGRDLREQKAAQEANERTQFMFENTPMAIMMWDKHFHVTDCNEEAVRLSGLSSKKEFVERFFELAPERQPNGQKSTEMAAVKLNEAMETGSSRLEWTHRSVDGKEIPYDLHVFRIKHGDDYVLVSYALDLREQKEIEELTRQQAAAEAAKRAKSAFLAQMGHEMRTPMNAIIGMMSVGKNAADIERKDYALDKIENAAKHLLSVINDVLDISEIETDRLELLPVEFDFEAMLQSVLDVIQFRIDEKKHQFAVNIDKKIPRRVMGDNHRLAQVITNLLSNAVKFTPEQGKIGLDVSLAGEQDGICELRIEVSDNGIGISSEHQALLFDAFSQAESGTNRTFGGTGLGLAISKRIVELMGGTIWVESEPGKGTRFIFSVKMEAAGRETVGMGAASVPASAAPGAQNAHGAQSAASSAATAGSAPATGGEPEDDMSGKLAGKKILIVEDVEINREILLALLEETGLIIDCAKNGVEAVEMVQADPHKYDLVFMDMQMPQMDGLEATRRIRTLLINHKRNLPIIAMTANVLKSDIEDCLAAGMDDHIGKPFDIDAVIQKLVSYLEN